MVQLMQSNHARTTASRRRRHPTRDRKNGLDNKDPARERQVLETGNARAGGWGWPNSSGTDWRESVMQHTSRDLLDAQWTILDPLIPEPERRKDGRGRPWRPRRRVLNGILWVLRTGAPWADLPERYPSYQTCHRRFQQWVRSGVMRGVLEALALDLKVRGALDVEEAFIDGSFAPAKKGAPR
jgi:transposase